MNSTRNLQISDLYLDPLIDIISISEAQQGNYEMKENIFWNG